MLHWLVLVTAMSLVRAGYMTVGMSQARQCNTSVVQWKGDDGPYHLLLTPTTFEQYGYNVWVPSIPNGTNSYHLPINQPAGLKFVVTVWGSSGVEYAGTTDVLTVQPSPNNNKTCFLKENEINNLYTFAFNITDSHDARPPQCSNMTISWPTSLESEIDNGTSTRAADEDVWSLRRRDEAEIEDVEDRAADDDFSSGANRTGSWNTTTPPTLFGIIPLGNSFSIPITYDKSKAKTFGLPDQYLSHEPTTWTEHGVTALNWTVNLAKGTRFILVAGIGSQEQWASGGSSEMMTVGQGSSSCFNVGGSSPSVTLSGTSTGALEPTETLADPGENNSQYNAGEPSSRWTGVILACIFSVLGTVVLCTIFWCCCRARRERKQAVKAGRPKPSFVNLASFGVLDRKYKQPDTQLDLIGPFSRDDASDGTPTNTMFGQRPFSTATSHGYDRDSMGSGDFANYGYPYSPPPVGTRSSMYDSAVPFRSSMYDDPTVSPYYHPTNQTTAAGGMVTNSPTTTSPTAMDRAASLPPRNRSFDQMGDFMGRQPSMDGMVSYPPMAHSLPPLKRQLLLGEDDNNSTEHLVQLKRDTIAALDRPGESSRGSSTTSVPGMLTVDTNIDPSSGGITPSPLSGLEEDNDPQGAYVVHRDAGRIPNSPTAAQSRVVELPPRYEELNWDREASGDVIEEAEATLGTTLASPSSPEHTVRHPLPLPPGAGPARSMRSPPPRSPSSPLSMGSPISSPRQSSSPRMREAHGVV